MKQFGLFGLVCAKACPGVIPPLGKGGSPFPKELPLGALPADKVRRLPSFRSLGKLHPLCRLSGPGRVLLRNSSTLPPGRHSPDSRVLVDLLAKHCRGSSRCYLLFGLLIRFVLLQPVGNSSKLNFSATVKIRFLEVLLQLLRKPFGTEV